MSASSSPNPNGLPNVKMVTRKWIPQLVVPTNASLDIPISVQKMVRYDVLLTSYMRSGSTFTGEILGHRPDSFYFYEPLHKSLGWNYYKQEGINGLQLCALGNFLCRAVENSSKQMLDHWQIGRRIATLRRGLNILNMIYNCNFTNFQRVLTDNLNINKSGPSWKEFRKCRKRKRDFGVCFHQLEEVCRKAKHRVTKVLRLGLGSVQSLLEQNKRLKVIHLFRDPREIMNSRIITTKWYPLNKRNLSQIHSNAKSLCDKMMHDYREGLQLKQLFPDRFAFIQYEDLIQQATQKKWALLKFLNMGVSDHIGEKSEMLSQFHITNKHTGYSGIDMNSRLKRDTSLALSRNIKDRHRVLKHKLETGKNNVTRESSISQSRKQARGDKWRKSLPWPIVLKVDDACGEVYDVLGYNRITKQEDVKNFSYPAVKVPLYFPLQKTQIFDKSHVAR